MGILSRFRDIMVSNVNALLDKAEDPEKTIGDYMRSLNSDLGKVKAETASVLAEERRAKRTLDECAAEIKKLRRYAEKAVETGNEDDAGKFLEKAAALAAKEAPLQAAYDLASSNAASMRQMQEKLVSDIGELEARYAELKGKMAATKVQQRLNRIGSPLGGINDSVFAELEEKVESTYNEAMAITELRAGAKGNLDEELAKLDIDTKKNTEDATAVIKENMKKKE
ncbi:PspA/IM30 family protein [Paenibacillus allorhizosphaerae]|uniref:Phage shock protein A n=1 Tax=Paenibacillus allorhizosphaerae TaxID=2849866 RepID=A0ABM8VIM9_9BACL|nr:PspA/IM30 family protein [Paenibacillus allorhizosphaerae]CAG7644169.1 Phage shock protein A [Paenibacillus allorhizosphaerae]